MSILIVNGPNLNLLGTREPSVYGTQTLKDLEVLLCSSFPEEEFLFFQSNLEGEIIDFIQNAPETCKGMVINPGGYAHTSVAIADALRAFRKPIIEVHISNIFARESFRHTLITAAASKGCISGLGFEGYALAVRALL